MNGIYSELKELIQLRLKARKLNIFRNTVPKSQLAGGSLSSYKGRGIDFDEVRAYQPGDDIRTIDWRVTARRSKPHTKVFREERERPVLIILDQSHSLFFGSQLNFKSVTACEIAAMLSWATLYHGDRIGGVIFNEKSLCNIRPKHSKTALIHFLQKAEELNNQLHLSAAPSQAPTGYFSKALRHARRVAHPGTQIFIISDFKDLNDDATQLMAQLRRHCEIIAFQISDPLEQELPKPDTYVVTNGVHRYTLDSRKRNHRQQFRDYQQAQTKKIQRRLREYRIPLTQISSGKETVPQLLLRFSAKRPSSHLGSLKSEI
ncbi:MAG: DUF58 domain-containing protein [Candidatus Endonucleobacter bathymodioli]|uniref:DUF58 domain-containing protein n=1 Tax=Candidatus Endonucleibacter bathymodioli TaxID=539814 RepID=A0AA90SMM1_9GAMM|nr:DUF58 domain-containing protein [Candidatus Endonucleobacter bathymodioli]